MIIPLKKKYLTHSNKGYRRNHNGNGARRVKKTISLPSVYSYDRNKHVLLVNAVTGHAVMVNYK